MRTATLAAIIMLLGLSVTARCESREITLDEAIRIALKENYELKARSYDLAAKQWGVRSAVTQFFPRVVFNTVFSRVDNTTSSMQNFQLEIARRFGIEVPFPYIPRNSYTSELTITQPIYNGGSLWANLSVARNSRDAGRHAYDDARLNTILETKRAFFNVLRAEDILDIRRRSVALAQEYLESAKLRLSLGMVSNVEVLRWDLQLAENRSDLTQAENDVVLSHIALAKAVGADLATVFDPTHLTDEEIEGAVEKLRADLTSDFERCLRDWSAEAYTNSPSLMSVRVGTAVKRALYRRTYSLFQPSLNFSYAYSWETDDDIRLDGLETWRASVILSFPLFSSLGDYASLREAHDDLKSAEASEREFERTTALQVASAASGLRALLQQIDAAKISRDLAAENARIVENRFKNGVIDNLNMIDAQIAQTAAEAKYVSAVYDFLIAQAEMDRLLGRQSY
jgi:outer membrane protein